MENIIKRVIQNKRYENILRRFISIVNPGVCKVRANLSIKNKIKHKVIYIIPDRKVPCGGVTVLNRHVELLLSRGVMVQKLALDSNLYRVDSKDPDVVTVIPEFWCSIPPKTKKRIVFIQNHSLVPKTANLKHYDQIWTNSQFVHDFVRERFGFESHIIHNWLDDKLFFGATIRKNKKPKAALMPRKGAEYVNRLIKDFPEIDFNVIGSFEIENMGVTPAFVAERLRESDIYVHTGFPEGMPLPVQEAMMSKCAVIGFSGGGGLEMMKHGETALVCPDGDYPSLVKTLQEILENEQLRTKLQEAGYAYCQKYTSDHLYSQLENSFSKL